MAYLAPILDGQCLRDYPPKVDYKVEEILKIHETALGNIRSHRIGFRYVFTLDWRNSLITETQWNVIRQIVNKNTTVSLIPFPDKYYSKSFTVKIINGINNVAVRGYVGIGYTGKLICETADPVVEIDSWNV